MTRFRLTDIELIAIAVLFLVLVTIWQLTGLGTVAALAAMTDIAITRTCVRRARRAAAAPATPPPAPRPDA